MCNRQHVVQKRIENVCRRLKHICTHTCTIYTEIRFSSSHLVSRWIHALYECIEAKAALSISPLSNVLNNRYTLTYAQEFISSQAHKMWFRFVPFLFPFRKRNNSIYTNRKTKQQRKRDQTIHWHTNSDGIYVCELHMRARFFLFLFLFLLLCRLFQTIWPFALKTFYVIFFSSDWDRVKCIWLFLFRWQRLNQWNERLWYVDCISCVHVFISLMCLRIRVFCICIVHRQATKITPNWKNKQAGWRC